MGIHVLFEPLNGTRQITVFVCVFGLGVELVLRRFLMGKLGVPPNELGRGITGVLSLVLP
jgi:hypothetical protein